MDAIFYSVLSLLSGSNYGCLIGSMEAQRENVCVCALVCGVREKL